MLITLLLIMTGSASLRLASMITHDMRHTILLKKPAITFLKPQELQIRNSETPSSKLMNAGY